MAADRHRSAVSFQAHDGFRDRQRPRGQGQQVYHNESEDGGTPCSRGDWCAGRKIITEGDTRRIIPALTYGPFCPACRTVISGRLADLPAAYERLQAEIGEPVRRNSDIRTPLGPRLPLRADVDEVMRGIEEQLLSWSERVRDVARLTPVDTQASRRADPRQAVADAARLLGEDTYLSVLLALEPGPMLRCVAVKGAPDEIVLEDLSGQDAGEEILTLHRRAERILGEIRTRPEALEAVPCKMCDGMGTLERAEPPSDPAREAMWSRCGACSHMMTRTQFDEWVKWYAKWADGAGLTCKRCTSGDHGDCQYPACACRDGEHPRRRSAA